MKYLTQKPIFRFVKQIFLRVKSKILVISGYLLIFSMHSLFLISSKIQKRLPPKILLGLCLSLSATLLVFVLGVENSSNRNACRVVAAILHYCLLTTFMWNTVEGINLYLYFVKVYNTHVNNFMLKSCFFAVGKSTSYFLFVFVVFQFVSLLLCYLAAILLHYCFINLLKSTFC